MQEYRDLCCPWTVYLVTPPTLFFRLLASPIMRKVRFFAHRFQKINPPYYYITFLMLHGGESLPSTIPGLLFGNCAYIAGDIAGEADPQR